MGTFVALGLGADAGLAFGLLRRIREVVWAAVGYALLAAWGRPSAGRTRAELDGGPPSAGVRRGASGS